MSEEKKTIPQVSVDTQMIYDRLVKASVGEVVKYSELSALIGRDVQGVARGNLQSARNMALYQNRMVFGCIHDIGLKRLDDHEIVGAGTNTIKRIRKAARRGAINLASVKDFEGLPQDDKLRHNALLSTLGVITMFSKEKSVKRIEEKVEAKQAKLPLTQTLELFK